MQLMHDVAKEYSYGTRCSQLLDCCEDEGCPQIKPQLDLDTTRVAAQHTLLRTNLRIHKDHNRYVVKNGKEKEMRSKERKAKRYLKDVTVTKKRSKIIQQ